MDATLTLPPSNDVKGSTGVVTFAGKLDTLIKTPGVEYRAIDWPGLLELVRCPTAVVKEFAPAIIPSTYRAHDARSHNSQRERGEFVMLAADIDKGNPTLEQLKDATSAITQGAEFLIYSTSSATPEIRKWRVLIPLEQPLPGEEYGGMQRALFSLYADHGIQCDQTLARTAQPVFLPNVPPERRGPDGMPQHYMAFHHADVWMDLTPSCPVVLRCRELYRQDREARELAASEARKKYDARAKLFTGEDVNPTQWFNANHSVEAVLLQYGYKTDRKGHWQSPYQTSGSYATSITDDGQAFTSLSASDRDKGLGAISKSGACIYGDAFDLYCHFEHGNDKSQAWSAIRRKMPRKDLPSRVVDYPYDDEKPDRADDNGLICNAKGKPYANVANVMTVLRAAPDWQGVVAYDRMAAKVILQAPVPDVSGRKPNNFRPRTLTDGDIVKATEWFQHNGLTSISKETVADGLAAIAEENGFDPLEDKLRSLRWDGKPRIDSWLLDYCGAGITDTQPEAYIKAVGRCWLISAVARALRPGCKVDTALVMVGPQGIGKSTAGRILAYDWFSDALPPVHSKDASDHLRGVWIVEFGEMATASRADVEELKAFVTRTVERFRPAYGRLEIEYPRRNVFFGTSNRDAFLKDETGNRRFWPVEVTAIDARRLEADRDQLWAEAVHAYDNGKQWHLSDDEAQLAAVQQAAYVVTDERTDLLAKRIAGRTTTTTLECLQLLEMKNEKREQMEVGGMLKSLGWRRRNNGKTKIWEAPLSTSSAERWTPGGQQDGDWG